MYFYEKKILERITRQLISKFRGRIISVHAFGSKARGDHDKSSDFDILIVVKNRNPAIEDRIMEIIVQEEMKSGLSFTPVIKDLSSFELEMRYNSPFYQNITKEGIRI
ncbi:MAG: nucleotidyltransferase domain-containing protein [Deltaproteobacteria bacterium]|nr:nucleotidyltransferase domain-containing protein [Deltaproteobacteria bacterium]MBW1921646.1 nucleotidyltransferase domain-containing protein [Deltaproteobacteria bacterium]MBW1936839.1 nucleotidyltransferase domain-containing protein [Deltaproteobacteria bacterium]MBW1978720.1 nucleotidyltransferase domain-containing protein [Deltaproteobacteria bacterium]MBW2046732.1 nucleotidyltransferase domain-containing protein [Deltaproteobacteria bacterium]